MPRLKEKDISDFLKDNWESFFKPGKCELYKTDKSFLKRWRPDFIGVNKDYFEGVTLVFIELKYNSNCRDLLYEVQRAIDVRNKGHNVIIAVLSDHYKDETIRNFLLENDVILLKYEFMDLDVDSFKIRQLNTVNIDGQDINLLN